MTTRSWRSTPPRRRRSPSKSGSTRIAKKSRSSKLRIEAALREPMPPPPLAELQDEAERLARLPKGSAPEREVAQVALRAESQKAQLAMAKAAVPKLEAELKKIDAERAALEATVRAAEVEVAKAKLTLGRMEVPSPADGIVLRLLAVPGGKRMLEMDDPDSSTVAILFEPDKLQVRADVPLAEAGNLAVGQPAKITCDLLPDAAFTGVVTRIVGEADIARNTLQAKVRIYDPDPRLAPRDALPRPPSRRPPSGTRALTPAASAAGGGRLTLYAPESGIRGIRGGGGNAVRLGGRS
ncbi:MAG: HlyD family efflux transporter periplasmic adaptor subunit [Verrucomicrobiales bacterium]